jgi:hypothetical protein
MFANLRLKSDSTYNTSVTQPGKFARPHSPLLHDGFIFFFFIMLLENITSLSNSFSCVSKTSLTETEKIRSDPDNVRNFSFTYSFVKEEYWHRGKILCLSSSPFLNIFVSGSDIGEIKLWSCQGF